MEITVTEVPQSFRVLAGLTDFDGVIFRGECANTSGTVTVYRRRSIVAPSATDAAFRHPPGDSWDMEVFGDSWGATWLWTGGGQAEVIMATVIRG